MIAVLSTGPLGGRGRAIYDRITRLTGAQESFHLFEGEPSPEELADFTTIILLDDWDSWLTRKFLGRYVPIQKARGYRYKHDHQTVIPTYSPFLLNGRMSLLPVATWDFRMALRHDRKPLPEFPLEDLELHPSPQDFGRFCSDASFAEFVSVDLETADMQDDDEENKTGTVVTRASLAYPLPDGEIRAITFPWVEPYITYFAGLMAHDVPKVFWNGWGFDLLRLEEVCIPVSGRIYDGMWLYHFLQPTLPKALGSVSTFYIDCPEWKSLNSEKPELYSAMDAWATAHNFIGIRESLGKRNAWELAERHVTDILYILEAMRQRGVRIDEGRLAEFNAYCDQQMAEMQERFNNHPDLRALRPLHPKEGYKKEPKDKTDKELVLFLLSISCEEAACPNPSSSHTHYKHAERWAKREDFLATSSQQVAKYFDSKGYEYKNADEPTLSALARKHKDPLLREFIKFRELKKLRGTYGSWMLWEDRRVHTTLTLRPDTHRLSSIEPNLQNVPSEFKHVMVAAPGNKLIEVDLSSVEAVLTGWFAGDPEYIRRAKIGIHKIAMAQYLGHPVDFSKPDKEIKAFLKGLCTKHSPDDPSCEGIKDLDPKLYRMLKTVIYGGNYLAGARTIYQRNPEDFASESECRKFMTFTKGLSPKVPEFQQRTINQAQITHALTNPFGYFKAFWDLPGRDGPAAVAFMPQSTTAAIMKEIMLQLWKIEAGKYMVLQVHDSLVFDVPEDKVELVKAQAIQAFTQAWPQLNGLALGCDVKVGDSLAFE